MEVFLLWLDELDDLLAILRHALPRMLSLALALGLFALTGVALLHWPWLAALPLLGYLTWRARQHRLLVRTNP